MEVINALGRRKSAIARVYVNPGKGAITINERPLELYFPMDTLQYIVKQPLELTGTGPGVALSLVPLSLRAEMEPPELPAYGRILLDVLCANSALSIRADEAEEAWRVLTPVLDGWAHDLAPLMEYDAGSSGP